MLELCGYPMVKKFDDIVTRFDTVHNRDRQQDGHRTTASAALTHSIARQKLLFQPKERRRIDTHAHRSGRGRRDVTSINRKRYFVIYDGATGRTSSGCAWR